jgi:diadenylate cyclase
MEEENEKEGVNVETKEVELFVPKKDEVQVDVEEKDFFDVLKMVAPGTSIRAALDDLLNAEMGALIVLDNGRIKGLFEKGFKIYCKFSSQKLVELAKMDGAIILSRDAKKIYYANSLLTPDPKIITKETGTRHKAAERISRQGGAVVIAISERKRKITLYYGDKRHELNKSSEVLRRASENMQILEKHRESLDESITDLNVLELQKMVTIHDVSKVIQDFEILKKISEVIKKHLIELGREGTIVSSRLKNLTRGLEKEEEFVLKDYVLQNYAEVEKSLEKLGIDELTDTQDISAILFNEITDRKISPRGVRILKKTNIPERYIDSLVANFGSLDKILSARYEDLLKVFQNEGMVDFFKEELYGLREKISRGKKI